MITLGAVIAYAIGAGFFHVKSGWRWMVGLGSVPAAVQFFLLFLLPESRRLTSYAQHTCIHDPTFFDSLIARILLYKRNVSGAREVMCKIYANANPEDIDLKVPYPFIPDLS